MKLRLGLQLRVVFILAAIIVAVTAAGGWSYYASARRSLRQGDDAHAAHLAQSLAVAARYHLRDGRTAELQRLASDFVVSENVRFVAIVAPKGDVVALACRDGGEWTELMSLPTSTYATDQPAPEVLTVARPVAIRDGGAPRDGGLVGAVRVVFDTSATTASLHDVQKRITLMAAAIIAGAVPLGYLLLSRLLVHPLRSLVGFTRRLGRGEDLDFRGVELALVDADVVD